VTATWVGINDVAWGVDAEEFVEKLIQQHEALYDAGLRNFLWVNVPPLYLFPGQPSSSCDNRSLTTKIPNRPDWRLA